MTALKRWLSHLIRASLLEICIFPLDVNSIQQKHESVFIGNNSHNISWIQPSGLFVSFSTHIHCAATMPLNFLSHGEFVPLFICSLLKWIINEKLQIKSKFSPSCWSSFHRCSPLQPAVFACSYLSVSAVLSAISSLLSVNAWSFAFMTKFQKQF